MTKSELIAAEENTLLKTVFMDSTMFERFGEDPMFRPCIFTVLKPYQGGIEVRGMLTSSAIHRTGYDYISGLQDTVMQYGTPVTDDTLLMEIVGLTHAEIESV